MSDERMLNDCGCCEGVKALTPAALDNPPGQTAIRYRVGTHASFKQSMLADIARQGALAGLKTRADDDPSIALTDAFAVMLDVLTFYQERIANEGYLNCATEQRSILELARAIGYELNPGVAASTNLAFTMEDAPGAPASVKIPAGTMAQSVPGQNEVPQTFETSEEIEARPAWNALKPRRVKRADLRFGQDHIYLEGTATNLKPGDVLLFIGEERAGSATQPPNPDNENWDVRRVLTVKPEDENRRTLVTWTPGLGTSIPHHVEPAKKNARVYALRTRASIFGYNAPTWHSLPVALRVGERNPNPAGTPVVLPGAFAGRESNWAEKKFPAGTTRINLDAVYSQITADSWVVLERPATASEQQYAEVFSVKEAIEESKADFLLAGKTTRLTLEGEHLELFSPRNCSVFGQSEELTVAAAPLPDPMPRNDIVLATKVEGLARNRWIAVSGKVWRSPGDVDSAVTSEVAQIDETDSEDGLTRLHLKSDLKHDYQLVSVTINANVAPATHGETRKEVLGSGDASQALQRFVLKQSPLTYVSAATSSGAASTLSIRVNDLEWQEVRALYGHGRDEQVYATRINSDGKAVVQFGDATQGARLPTGVENVNATYRVGTGQAGMVKAGQISLLMTRPLGVREVLNPLAPEGGQDPETEGSARHNAPFTVLTMDRVVSLLDFENFARTFRGIGKAQATWLWDGESRIVFVTLAGPAGDPVDDTNPVLGHLQTAIEEAKDPTARVKFVTYDSLLFRITAKVKVDVPRFDKAKVHAAINDALDSAFAFEAREFAQPVSQSEVLAIIQNVAGVIAVDLDELYQSSPVPDPLPPKLGDLTARIARRENGAVEPAQLLTLEPGGLELKDMTL